MNFILTLLVPRQTVVLLSLVPRNASNATELLLTIHFRRASYVIVDGVDKSDKMFYSFVDERKLVKFWKIGKFEKSYIIYQHSNNKKMTGNKFQHYK